SNLEVDPRAKSNITLISAVQASKQQQQQQLQKLDQFSSSSSQLRRKHCQRRSPRSSPILSVHDGTRMLNKPPRRSLTPSTTNNSNSTSHLSNILTQKYRQTFSSVEPTNCKINKNNYYTKLAPRSVNNCEKFLPDHDLNGSKENDLLLMNRQSARFQ
ncbi:unnamed protein product, partial [Didymodactylos carnosus]